MEDANRRFLGTVARAVTEARRVYDGVAKPLFQQSLDQRRQGSRKVSRAKKASKKVRKQLNLALRKLENAPDYPENPGLQYVIKVGKECTQAWSQFYRHFLQSLDPDPRRQWTKEDEAELGSYLKKAEEQQKIFSQYVKIRAVHQ
jgi:hypothetical protein